MSWNRANGPHYERVAKGRYLPRVRSGSAEQRTLEAAALLEPDGSRGCVTGWAALRWRGARYFDGLDQAGVEQVPVQLALPPWHTRRDRPGVIWNRETVGSREWELVDGLPCTTVARALYDEVVTRGSLWPGIQAICMTAAARLISVWLFALFVGSCNGRTGAPLVRHAVSLSADEFLSPREPWQWCVWTLAAGLPPPLVNQPLYDLGGGLIGVPDLFDPVSGTAAEYVGEVHRSKRQHRKDVVRGEAFRDHRIEVVETLAGDTVREAADRILRARSRALFLPPEQRLWTLERPAWDPAPETLDAYFERTGQVERLIASDTRAPGSPLLGHPRTALEG